jgi:hypothetical protein
LTVSRLLLKILIDPVYNAFGLVTYPNAVDKPAVFGGWIDQVYETELFDEAQPLHLRAPEYPFLKRAYGYHDI